MELKDNTNNDDENLTRQNNFRRKNKKNKFLQNAKGFGKRGNLGRGTLVSDDIYQYFINILDAMNLGFESPMEKCSMADNAFDQCKDNEIDFASNQVISKALEFLVGFTSEKNFSNFMTIFSENFRPICSDPFSSHVLQKMVEIAFLRGVGFNNSEDVNSEESDSKRSKVDPIEDTVHNTTHKFSKKHRTECSDFVLKIGKFLLNNLEDFVWDTCASHIMRTSILCLSGMLPTKTAFDQNKDLLKSTRYYEVPIEWIEIAKEFPQRLELWPQFSELPNSDLTSAFLSTICCTLKHTDKNLLKHFGRKILVESFLQENNDNDEKDDKKIEIGSGDENEKQVNEADKKVENIKVAKVFHASASIRLLETLLSVAGPKLFTQLYAMLFPGKVAILALDRSTNFAVQKLIEHVKEKVDFETIFDELNDQFEELLKVGHTGVVLALSTSCLRLQTKQGAFIGAIQVALHIANSKERSDQIFKCILKLKPYEITIKDKSSFVHLHGSVILQNILKFNKPIFLVNCILNCTPMELLEIFNSQKGSFIADAFLESKFIGEKSRDKLIKHMEGTYIDLATTKFGSHIIEKFFECSNDNQRNQIVKQLSEKINQLNATFFGRLISKKFRVETYKLSQSSWKQSYNRANKAEKLFKDIVSK